MKITIFGLTLSSSWGNGHATPYRAIIRALARRGHQVTFFEKDVEYYYWRRDLKDCDYCKLVLYPDWESVRQRAMAEACTSDALIIGSYCPAGTRIADELLALSSPLKVFYDLDTPVTLSKLEAADYEYLRADHVGAFDLYLSFTGGAILKELESQWGARSARALYGCVDPDVHRRVPAMEQYQCDLSYMGTYAEDRQHKVDELFVRPALKLPEASFVLAGALYPKSRTWPDNVRRFDHVPPCSHPALYSSSRATLNLTRDSMARGGYCPSGRFFEAAACGTLILSDWFAGLDSFFEPGKEILVVRSGNEVAEALRVPQHDLAKIAERAEERTLAEHTGEVRAGQLLRYLEEARSNQRWSGKSEVSPVEAIS